MKFFEYDKRVRNLDHVVDLKDDPVNGEDRVVVALTSGTTFAIPGITVAEFAKQTGIKITKLKVKENVDESQRGD